MKKRLLFFSLLLSVAFSYGQKVQWGDFYTCEDHNKTRFDYMGNIDGKDYYSFGYYVTGGYLGRFNRIGFFSFTDTNNFNERKDFITFPKNSLITTCVTSNEPAFIYEDKNKDNSQNRDIIISYVDKNSFTQQKTKTLLTFDKKNTHSYYSSKNKNYHLFVVYQWDKKKKNIENMSLNVFDKDFNLLWSKDLKNQTVADMWIRDILITDNGEVYTLCSYYENVSDKKDKSESLWITYSSKEDNYRRIIEYNEEIDEAGLCPLKDDMVLVGLITDNEFKTLTFSLRESKVISTSSFTLKMSNSEKKKAKDQAVWNISDFLTLDNGNVVCIVKDMFSVWVEPAKSPGYLEKFDRNFYVLCVNPKQKDLVYSQLISRSTKYVVQYRIQRTDYEKPIFYTYNNNVYAIYNTDGKDDEFSGKIHTTPYVEYFNKPKEIVSRILKITPDGKAESENIITYKDAKAMISTTMTHEKEKGKIILGSRGKKDVSMGIININ
ncbi:MAG: hypothetical protein IJ213_06210 [Bacteroidales bacterium]|nr:hypothetical protein [Bacteroidales bacterium]